MKRAVLFTIIGLVAIAFCLIPMASYAKTSYFGVPNKALGYPEEFDQTEAAITKAEQSPGAKNCPEKIAKAKELARKGVETYWACLTKEAMALLAQAREMAQAAERCGTVAATLSAVHFAFDSAELTSQGQAILDEQIPSLKASTNDIEVAGHACSLGTEAYNEGLAERRAQTVYKYLVAKGIAAERLTVVSYGETRPAFSNDTEEGRSKNRRVELVFD
jgi:outer membrane protein OmpA-like peptidoglycan-associated protein